MYEVEVKVPAELGAVRSRLEEMDAVFEGSVEQADTYFDAPHRDFAETDEALRVRRETVDVETTARITYKGPLVEAESKTRAEIETGVANGDDATAIFEQLGFVPVQTVEKTRERYRVGSYVVVLDDVSGLGTFVEVETESGEDAEALETARSGAFELLRRLGLDPDDQVRTSYLGLLLDPEDNQ